jgi:cytochrome b subunit of formate dehydrogenase
MASEQSEADVRTGLKEEEFLRFALFYRILHMLMLSSFLLLVLTGIPLHFSDAPWALPLIRLLGGPVMAAVLHRLGAVMMFGYAALFIAHIGYRWLVQREKGLFWGPDSLVFQPADWWDFLYHVRWFVGRGERPTFERWTYWEKFDFWADAWGVLVLGTTGLILWFPVLFTRILPGWAINLALIIHSIEALLALSFIFLIHFFSANLRPGKFPVDLVIFTGRMSRAELRQERPLWYERLERLGRASFTTPLTPPGVHRAAKIFALSALSIGLGTVLLVLVTVFIGLFYG